MTQHRAQREREKYPDTAKKSETASLRQPDFMHLAVLKSSE
jgi:hypothetical protein